MTGSGTLLDPYVIWDVNDLQDMNLDLTAYYELGQDIDASATVGWNGGLGFAPIAPRPPVADYFSGSFDGKGYEITDLFINRPADSVIGLFGQIRGASIQNVGLVNCNITGNSQVAGLVGWSSSWSGDNTIFNCYISGVVTGNGDRVGGLIGETSGPVDSTTITQCYSTADITGDDEVGGLVGLLMDATLSRCYATGNVTGSTYTGGLVGDGTSRIERSYATGNILSDSGSVGGLIGGSYGPIINCYARGSVFGNVDVGGLVGVNGNLGSIDNCYSTGAVSGNFAPVGGLVGSQAAGATAPTDSFWDTDTSGLLVSAGGTGKTTAEMKTGSTFTDADWSFGTIWGMTGACNNGYACLLDVTPSCAWAPHKGNIVIDQLIYQHAERMRR